MLFQEFLEKIDDKMGKFPKFLIKFSEKMQFIKNFTKKLKKFRAVFISQANANSSVFF